MVFISKGNNLQNSNEYIKYPDSVVFVRKSHTVDSSLNDQQQNRLIIISINQRITQIQLNFDKYQSVSQAYSNPSAIKMKKSPIKVIIRMRPTSNFAHQNMNVDQQTGTIGIHIERPLDQGIVNHQQNQWGFNFEKVLANASQDVMFNLSAKQILTSALDGYSGCVLCYGQTGAGKTFTMTGAQSDYKYRGITPRVISNLFQEINSRYEHQIKVSVSYLQLYNQNLGDLLDESNTNQLSIQEDSKGYVLVKGLTKKTCENEQDALQMLFEGENNRTVAEHKLNRNSSRSHCIFTLHLEIRSRVESSEKVVMSKINLVDLAGSQRTKKTGSEGKTLVEAQFINRSLSFLEQLVVALSEKKRDHIPYRQNKLTYLLKDSIGGNSKTCMVANVWPEYSHLEQTISTLKFASRMMKVSNEISVQMNLDPKLLLKKYEKDIRQLKQELAMHDTLASRGRINYQPYTPQQQHKQQSIAQDFLDGKTDDIQIESLRQVRQLFFQFRNIYKSAIKDIDNNSFVRKQTMKMEQKQEAEKQKDNSKKVGVQETNFGFGVGKAVKQSKPTQNISNLVNIPKDAFQQQGEQGEGVKTQRSNLRPEKKIVNVDKNQAYQEFKSTSGQQLNNSIVKNIQELKVKKEQIKQKTEEVQKKKTKLDDVSSALKLKQQNKTQEQLSKNIIDEEEFQMMKQKKLLKREYKIEVDKIKALRNDIIEIDRNVTSLKTALIQKFEQWFFKRYGISISDLENPLINQNEEANQQQQRLAQRPRSDDIDEDALAYIHAKKKVAQLQRARRNEKRV